MRLTPSYANLTLEYMWSGVERFKSKYACVRACVCLPLMWQCGAHKGCGSETSPPTQDLLVESGFPACRCGRQAYPGYRGRQDSRVLEAARGVCVDWGWWKSRPVDTGADSGGRGMRPGAAEVGGGAEGGDRWRRPGAVATGWWRQGGCSNGEWRRVRV
jgi:hypothetical protein